MLDLTIFAGGWRREGGFEKYVGDRKNVTQGHVGGCERVNGTHRALVINLWGMRPRGGEDRTRGDRGAVWRPVQVYVDQLEMERLLLQGHVPRSSADG